MVNAELLHARLKATLGHKCIPMDQFIWVDEGRVGDWIDEFGNTRPYTMILALSSSGVVTFETIKGYVSKEMFYIFVSQKLICLFTFSFTYHIQTKVFKPSSLLPYPGLQSIVVMDNWMGHHDNDIKLIIKHKCGKWNCTIFLHWHILCPQDITMDFDNASGHEIIKKAMSDLWEMIISTTNPEANISPLTFD